MDKRLRFLFYFFVLGTVSLLFSAGKDPVGDVVLGLMIILLAANIGGYLFEKIGQPAVLGELTAGVILGNIHLLLAPFGIEFTFFHHLFYGLPDETHKFRSYLEIIGGIGVILLLFQVGLETRLADMMKVGIPSFLVAIFGVVTPFFLGYWISLVFHPEESFYIHLYVGATLVATSVGITARVFQDLGKITSKEARIILGAAVIDDILGLIILAVVVGVIQQANLTGEASLPIGDVLYIVALAFGFLFLSLVLGVYLGPTLIRWANKIKTHGMKLIVALSFCFLFSWGANAIGLAPIVGAFAAGLILEEVHFKEYSRKISLEELLEPLNAVFVPVFFVMMGVGVKLETFGNIGVLGVALGITIVAIIGKQSASLGVLGTKGVDKIAVGLGMIPRGEVGLIFAAIGKALHIQGVPVVNDELYSAIVIMVILTTLVTPPLLSWKLKKISS